MYNVKILKYPTGWQYRIYSRPVGYCDKKKDDDYVFMSVIVNENTGERDTRFVNPKTAWYNPFTGDLEVEPLEEFVEGWDETELQRRKERSLKNSLHRTVNKVYHLSRSNIWDWFVTLTFDPDKVNSFNYDECVKYLKSWIDTIRRYSPDLKYIIVPEPHKSGRFHFHGLMANCEGLDFVESGHSTKSGQPIYNIGKYRLGFATATKVTENERVTKYISKYITKELCAVALGKKRYWCSRNLDECPTEELLVYDNADIKKMLAELQAKASHVKVCEGAELTTTYIEMGCMNG